jgi:hypothetical protein|tara:strand:+ start:17 stop:274 length:258 start_codon:yes stop_codon:yes gene_type:complete
MTYVYKKEMKLAPLEVEYVMSSVTNGIKIVDMIYGGQPTKSSYMSDESRLELIDELERDYLDKTGPEPTSTDSPLIETELFKKYG